MREYYARFFREVGRQMFIFWKAQIWVSLAAGTIAALANSVRQATPLAVALWSVGIAAIGYLAILGVFSIWAVMSAPVRLDQQRTTEMQKQKEDDERETAFHREDAKQQHFGRVKAEAELRTERARKHPHDEQKSAYVRNALAQTGEEDRAIFRWLLNNGETIRHQLPHHLPRCNEAINVGTGLTQPLVLTRREETPGGRYEYVRMNENYNEALRDFLFPAPPIAR